MMIEIRTAKDEAEEFEHEGYYDSIGEAIEWLQLLKQREDLDKKIASMKDNRLKSYVDCNKCVWQYIRCPGPVTKQNALTMDTVISCPSGYKFKRDPPDGGYYG